MELLVVCLHGNFSFSLRKIFNYRANSYVGELTTGWMGISFRTKSSRSLKEEEKITVNLINYYGKCL